MATTKGEKVTAVLVLYHPEPSLLDRLIKSALGQVDRMIIVDNTTPDPLADPIALFEKSGIEFHYQSLGDNLGVAAAQNRGIEKAIKDGCTHVLLLDQDSALPSGMVAQLLEAESSLLNSGISVAAVGPAFVHEKTKALEKAIRYGFFWAKGIAIDPNSTAPVETDCLIASGSLIRVSVLHSVGLMREDLFIDLVDIEWGLRAKYLDLKSYMIPSVVMTHNLGKTSVKVKNKWFYFHNEVRYYYIVRNSTYLLRLKTMGIRWRSAAPLKIARDFAVYVLFSDHKLKTFCLLFRAFVDGLCGKLGRLDTI